MYAARDDFIMGMNILGATIRGSQMKLGRGHGVNITAIVHQMDRMGVGAIPVVVLMSAIVGAIIAQQGAYQLSYFGADIFVVDLVGVLSLRELGVLMTAIMVAGRSGSAFTAEIGMMKVNEEIDALRTLGLDPLEVLVLPRLLALMIALPLLAFFADIMALFGGGLMCVVVLDVSPEQYLDRLGAAIWPRTFWVGIVKAPVFAFLIAMVACYEGLTVNGSAESVGRKTTLSVVVAIFLVIVFDAIFSVVFSALGI
jgi:phospholipid/cholesterol/gamma-HCH transport system permease protein